MDKGHDKKEGNTKKIDRYHLSREELYEYYIVNGLSSYKISKICGYKPRTIYNWLDKFGIKKRTAAQTRAFGFNSNFFKMHTPEFAWVLGLLFTDGTVKPNNRISLSQKDIEILNKVRSFVYPEGNILTYNQSYDKNNYINHFEFGSPEIIELLRVLGLEANKSLNMRFPKLPVCLARHFIRGCWDGDGGFSNVNGKISAHYTCGSYEFIETIRDILFHYGIVRRVLKSPDVVENKLLKESCEYKRYPLNIHARKDTKAFDLRISDADSLFRLFKFLYENVDTNILYTRKHFLLKSGLQARGYLLQLI